MATIWMMAALSAEPNAQDFHPHLYKTVPVQYLLVAARMQHHRVFKLRRRMASPYFFLFSAVVDIFRRRSAGNVKYLGSKNGVIDFGIQWVPNSIPPDAEKQSMFDIWSMSVLRPSQYHGTFPSQRGKRRAA
ncbi:predicted protein [Histoplasma capsulatum var. duboisii H88]|uniref:Predicted protein n=1 Tax=Ajellomyces capsulatus (strain H88) TaxID=544711 RepID=F0UGH5_AJEC8|nr:predicted protein [Histoplasma capsulatum var. duboisii H88]